MQYQFDDKIDLIIKKSLRVALRFFKDRQKDAQVAGAPPEQPSFEEFLSVLQESIEANKRVDLNRLRTPSLREIYERAWAQKLRNYAIQRQLKDAFDSLMRRL